MKEKHMNNVVYDYSKLRGRIVEKLGNITEFINVISISGTSFYKKINNQIEFKQSEIIEICNVLEIPSTEMHYYFFYTKS